MKKKIFLILNIINLLFFTAGAIASKCIKNKNNIEKNNTKINQNYNNKNYNEENNISDLDKQSKTLNEIGLKINKKILNWINENIYIDSKGDSEYSKIFNFLKSKKDEKINFKNREINNLEKNNNIYKIIKIKINEIQQKFQNYLFNLNNEIKNDYNNSYIDNEPILIIKLLNEKKINSKEEIEEEKEENKNRKKTENNKKNINIDNESETENTLYNINIKNIEKIEKEIKKNINIIIYNFEFKTKIIFENKETIFQQTITHIITDNIDETKKIQQKIFSKLFKIIKKYFNNKKEIILDQDENFKELWDNFDINYSREQIHINEVFKNNFNKMINENEDFKDIFHWNNNLSIVNINYLALTDETNGKQTPVKENTTAFQWAGLGKFDSKKENTINFYNFLLKNILKIEIRDQFQLANFNINFAAMNINGIPLNGILKENENFEIKFLISKEKFKEKILNFAKIVVKFFEIYEIECYKDRQIIYIPEKLFNKIKDKKYNYFLREINKDFINRKEVSELNDLKFFKILNYWNSDRNILRKIKKENEEIIIRKSLDNNEESSNTRYSFAFAFGKINNENNNDENEDEYDDEIEKSKILNDALVWSAWTNKYFGNLQIKIKK